MDGGLDAAERALVERIADRREEIVALTCELIGFDTTSRAETDAPAREEAALQQALAERLRAPGPRSTCGSRRRRTSPGTR